MPQSPSTPAKLASPLQSTTSAASEPVAQPHLPSSTKSMSMPVPPSSPSRALLAKMQLKVGISSSPAVCGTMGILRPQVVCVGECLSRAAELMRNANPSSILLDGAARSLLGGDFLMSEFRTISLPGHDMESEEFHPTSSVAAASLEMVFCAS